MQWAGAPPGTSCLKKQSATLVWAQNQQVSRLFVHKQHDSRPTLGEQSIVNTNLKLIHTVYGNAVPRTTMWCFFHSSRHSSWDQQEPVSQGMFVRQRASQQAPGGLGHACVNCSGCAHMWSRHGATPRWPQFFMCALLPLQRG
jgi:hypothetical protein